MLITTGSLTALAVLFIIRWLSHFVGNLPLHVFFTRSFTMYMIFFVKLGHFHEIEETVMTNKLKKKKKKTSAVSLIRVAGFRINTHCIGMKWVLRKVGSTINDIKIPAPISHVFYKVLIIFLLYLRRLYSSGNSMLKICRK